VDFSAACGIVVVAALKCAGPSARLIPDAEVRDVESEAIEVRGPPP
jgi:hypothetical protein